jgi:hypothetical protein
MKRTVALALLAVLMMGLSSAAQPIQPEILQVKLNRIYFGSGQENGIGLGAAFVVECGGKAMCEGVVEYAGPGISFSEPIPGIDTLRIESDCIVRLATSAVDSTATVTLGTNLPLALFDPEHETLLTRTGDSLAPNLIDSVKASGDSLFLYLPLDVNFSDGTRLNSDILTFFFKDLREHGRSYLTRYFFSKVLPNDSGGIEAVDGYTLRLVFYHSFPHAAYFLSHQDFAVYNKIGKGTGALVHLPGPDDRSDELSFEHNPFYRGDRPGFSRLTIKYYEQAHRLRFSFDEKQLDGYISFGFDTELAGACAARTYYPYTAVMIAGVGSELFSQSSFPASIYYRFDPALAHLYFPAGETQAINRWLVRSSGKDDQQRYYTFDFFKGKQLHGALRLSASNVRIAYDDYLLYDATRYLADIVAREGMTASPERFGAGRPFDIRLAFLPSSDSIMPFALYAAVLELNDQNQLLPAEKRMARPGWQDIDNASRQAAVADQNPYLARAEETLFAEAGFFPLFRPCVYAVTGAGIANIAFDFYGFPVIGRVAKLKTTAKRPGAGNRW